MFAYLKGTVDTVASDSCVLDVHDVGYLIASPKRTLDQLSVGLSCKLYIEAIFRQDMLHLYGFLSVQDKEWFKILLGVQGVGPRVALSILSILSIDELIQTITAQDKVMIGRADGVGPKLAGRLLLELKDKVKGLSFSSTGTALATATSTPFNASFNDALSALVNLGYTRVEALQALKDVPQDSINDATIDSATLIKEALRYLQIMQKKSR